MKNILLYFYNIVIDEKSINNGYFYYNNYLFNLYKYNRNINEINELYLLNNDLLNKNIIFNRIIPNNNNSLFTIYNDSYYILLLINNRSNNFNFIPINNYNNYKLLLRNNWSYLWSIKIDYIEYQMHHIGNKYLSIYNSINYYIGLTENAISYFNMINKDNIPLYLNHRRIENDLYNPLELVIDYKVRDIGEYLKYCFFKNRDIKSIINNLNNLNLNNIDYILLYIRMLYPSFYFDEYDNVINNKESLDKIDYIISKASLYEEFLYKLYIYINKKTNIIGLDWINKKFTSNTLEN